MPTWESCISVFYTIAEFREPYYGFPLGATCYAFAIFCGIYIGQRIFGSWNIEEIKGDVPFYIAANGARIDQISDGGDTNMAQRLLQWLIYLIGLMCILR